MKIKRDNAYATLLKPLPIWASLRMMLESEISSLVTTKKFRLIYIQYLHFSNSIQSPLKSFLISFFSLFPSPLYHTASASPSFSQAPYKAFSPALTNIPPVPLLLSSYLSDGAGKETGQAKPELFLVNGKKGKSVSTKLNLCPTIHMKGLAQSLMYKKGSTNVGFLLFVVVEVTSCPSILYDDGAGFRLGPLRIQPGLYGPGPILTHGGEFEIVAHFFFLLKESAPRRMQKVHLWGFLSHVWESYLCFLPPLSTRALCFLSSSHENFWYNISKTVSQDALSTVSQLALVSSDRIKENRKFPSVSHIRILFQFYNVCEFGHSVKCVSYCGSGFF